MAIEGRQSRYEVFWIIIQVLLLILGLYIAITLTQTWSTLRVHDAKLDTVRDSVATLTTRVEILTREQEKLRDQLTQHDMNLKSVEDSLLVKIALLDECIDKHFWRVNNRLSKIERKLDTASPR